MRVIHIIPSAFEYFNDIRSDVFTLIESLYAMGIETEAFTLQYGHPDKSTKAAVKSASPSVHNYMGSTGAKGLIEHLAGFDIVHLHCPFLGAARDILQWKKNNPKTPLVISYHRDVIFDDLFSLFIKFYNFHYLPKLFKAADVTICENFENFKYTPGFKKLHQENRVIGLKEMPLTPKLAKEKFNSVELVAVKTILVYNKLI